MWVRFSFRQLLIPAYASRYLRAPSGVVGVTYRDFNLLHWSLLKWFPLFIWLLFAFSSVPNFRPDTGGRRWSLVQVAGFVAAGRGGPGAAFPSTLLRLPAAFYGACPALRAVPALGCSTKAWTRLRLCFVPSPGQAAQAARSLTGALSPGAARLLRSASPAPVPIRAGRVPAPCV